MVNVIHTPVAGVLLLVASAAAAQTPSELAETTRRIQTIIVGVEATRRPADPLDARASVQFVNSDAANVFEVLARAQGLTVEMASSPLLPVTITLTNVRLRIAFDAICDTAGCTWRLEGTTIKVASAGARSSGGLPPTVSLSLKDVPVPDVFRAIGTALGINVTVGGQVERPPISIKFTAADTKDALDFVCKRAGCSWEFDQAARELRVRFSTK